MERAELVDRLDLDDLGAGRKPRGPRPERAFRKARRPPARPGRRSAPAGRTSRWDSSCGPRTCRACSRCNSRRGPSRLEDDVAELPVDLERQDVEHPLARRRVDDHDVLGVRDRCRVAPRDARPDGGLAAPDLTPACGAAAATLFAPFAGTKGLTGGVAGASTRTTARWLPRPDSGSQSPTPYFTSRPRAPRSTRRRSSRQQLSAAVKNDARRARNDRPQFLSSHVPPLSPFAQGKGVARSSLRSFIHYMRSQKAFDGRDHIIEFRRPACRNAHRQLIEIVQFGI
jgi:hypothetical protein